jgi:hypothetical protein
VISRSLGAFTDLLCRFPVGPNSAYDNAMSMARRFKPGGV